MQNTRFKFRFAAVKKSLEREKQVAEIELIRYRQQLQQLQQALSEHDKQLESSVEAWKESLNRQPELGVTSRAAFEVFQRQREQVLSAIAAAVNRCQQAERVFQEVSSRLASIERLEETDVAEFQSSVGKKAAAHFQEVILSQWNHPYSDRSK